MPPQLDIAGFPNLLDHVHFTAGELASQLEGFALRFERQRHFKVERTMRFPMFVNSFYRFVYLEGRVPRQLEFWQRYMGEYTGSLEALVTDRGIADGLRARAFRTYPSLVRDLHFALLLRETHTGGHVLYNRRLDVEWGIDLLVTDGGRHWAVNLFTDTGRGNLFRGKKAHRHGRFCNVTYLELPVDFRGSVKCGRFYLYGERELVQVRDAMTPA